MRSFLARFTSGVSSIFAGFNIAMEHFFDFPVTYKNEELIFKGRLVTFAYTYKLYIIVNGQELVFEKDDEGTFRILSEDIRQLPIEHGLLEALVATLRNL